MADAIPSASDRADRLRAAYEAGKISRELYERNLRAFGPPMSGPHDRDPPPPDEDPAHVATAFERAFEDSRRPSEGPADGGAPPPPEEVRAGRIREAYEAGRISREVYERNVGTGEAVNPPPPPVEDAVAPLSSASGAPVMNPPPPATPTPPAGFEERVAMLARAYEEGRLSRELYERNLARAYEAVDPRLANLRRALAEGRITQPAYVAGVRRLLQGRGVG